MGHGGDPFARQAEVGACLLGETLGQADGVEERPFKFVGVEFVLEVDVQGDDAAVGVVRVELVVYGRLVGRWGGGSGGWVGGGVG